MTTQANTPVQHVNPVRALIRRWLEPQSSTRDEAFRERSIRISLLLIITLGLLSFFNSIIVFKNAWEIISFPTLHVVMLGGCLASAVILQRQKLVGAGWALIIALLLTSSMLVLLGRQTGSASALVNAIPAFMIVVLVAALVLPRNTVLPISVAAVVFYAVSQFAISMGTPTLFGVTADQQITTSLILLLAEGALLYQLRGEFDARLDAMRESIQQTELARQQAEAAQQQAEADRKHSEEADRAKTQFLANMSHELRTPLNAIIGYDEAMIGGMVGTFTSEQTRLLKNIQVNSRRLLALINDILDLSKIESGSLEVYLAPLSPRQVLGEVVESLQSLAHEQEITLSITFSEKVPEVVLSDAKKIQQILVNLLSNAIKFTPQGEVAVEVDIVDNNNWRFKVRDTGIGMPPDAASVIFEPFKQIDSTDTRKYKGTGLGLAITKRLVERLSGDIQLETEYHEGSTFTVTLPRVNIPVVAEAEKSL